MNVDKTGDGDSGHLGYNNYPTWCVAMWIRQESLSYWKKQAIACFEAARADDVFTKEEAAIILLSREIQEAIEEDNTLSNTMTLYSDLLYSALEQVNWYEIAEEYIQTLNIEKE